jgi:hypothetical protein
MKIGVISDTHDNLPAIDAAVRHFQTAGVEVVLHGGDFVAPFALRRLLEARLPVVAVFGNCDGERAGLAQLLPDLSDGPRRLELGGRKICLVHNAQRLTHEDVEAADILLVGHTHEPKSERQEGRLIVNPGECCGWVTGRGTVAVVDTGVLTADFETVYQQARSSP